MRLSARLFRACLVDKRSLCPDVPPGHAAAKQCLEDAREELSPGCRAEVDGMIERRVRDFRLDSRLRKACESDIYDTCAYLGGLDSMDPYHSTIISCLQVRRTCMCVAAAFVREHWLQTKPQTHMTVVRNEPAISRDLTRTVHARTHAQDYKDELKSDACRGHVTKYMELAAQDVRFDVPLADACAQDRAAHCANVPPVRGRRLAGGSCLQRARGRRRGGCWNAGPGGALTEVPALPAALAVAAAAAALVARRARRA